mmetsp:Transcript_47710/g.102204  ORF Transcript_47710/g.102204 Transcript_47710/m.102204 type:complete len:295 (-) Transcript_47710:109-993(-)
MGNTTFAIRHDLNFDVSCIVQKLLEEHSPVPESSASLAGAAVECIHQFRLLLHKTHSTSSTAKGSLEDDGQRDVVGTAILIGHLARVHERRPPQNGNLARLRQLASSDLVSQQGDGVRLRSDELDAVVSASLGELCTLAEETVSRMDCPSTSLLGGSNDAPDVEVGGDWPRVRGLHLDGLVDSLHMQGAGVLFGIDADSAQTHLVAASRHPNGDFASICDQDLRKWQGDIAAPTNTSEQRHLHGRLLQDAAEAKAPDSLDHLGDAAKGKGKLRVPEVDGICIGVGGKVGSSRPS